MHNKLKENMVKFIYKITNNINGKIYIGQTFNLKQRLYKHSMRGPLSEDIKKYGIENFSMETLYAGEDYNEKEDYYINFYNSRDPEVGYNTYAGGRFVEGSVPGAVSDDIIALIKNDLIFSDLPLKDVAKKYNVPFSTINNINHGYSHASAFEKYPLRFNKSTSLKSKINEIYADLANYDLSLDEICNKYGIKRYTLLNINNGINYKHEGVNYPIRELNLPKTIRDQIINLLQTTNLTGKEIASMFDSNVVNIHTVYNLNSGKVWRDPNLTYPIRDLSVNSLTGGK